MRHHDNSDVMLLSVIAAFFVFALSVFVANKWPLVDGLFSRMFN